MKSYSESIRDVILLDIILDLDGVADAGYNVKDLITLLLASSWPAPNWVLTLAKSIFFVEVKSDSLVSALEMLSLLADCTFQLKRNSLNLFRQLFEGDVEVVAIDFGNKNRLVFIRHRALSVNFTLRGWHDPFKFELVREG